MFDARRPTDPLTELASLLAAGVLRLHARAALSGDSNGPCLEVSDETVLSVSSAS